MNRRKYDKFKSQYFAISVISFIAGILLGSIFLKNIAYQQLQPNAVIDVNIVLQKICIYILLFTPFLGIQIYRKLRGTMQLKHGIVIVGYHSIGTMIRTSDYMVAGVVLLCVTGSLILGYLLASFFKYVSVDA